MRNVLIATMGLGLALFPHFAGAQSPDQVTTYETTNSFSDASADLEDAIVNRGYVVDYHGFIGDMLKRTAGDVGADTPLYKDAEFLQFCSAVISRKAMETDIGNIAYCPYVLFVYEAAASPGTVTIGFRRMPEGGGRDDVNALLDEIAREAAGQ